MEQSLTFPEFIQWIKFFELEHEDREKAIRNPQKGPGPMSWEHQKHNILQHNKLMKNAIQH